MRRTLNERMTFYTSMSWSGMAISHISCWCCKPCTRTRIHGDNVNGHRQQSRHNLSTTPATRRWALGPYTLKGARERTETTHTVKVPIRSHRLYHATASFVSEAITLRGTDRAVSELMSLFVYLHDFL